MSKHDDNHTHKFNSADDLLLAAVQPKGDFKVAVGIVDVYRGFKVNVSTIVILVAVIGLGLGASKHGNNITTFLYLLAIIVACLIRVWVWIKGLRDLPGAVVLHDNTVSVIEGVLYNKIDRTYTYQSADHIPVGSISKKSFFDFSTNLTFLSKPERVDVMLKSTRKTRKQEFYKTNVISVRDMKRLLFLTLRALQQK